MSMRIGCAVGRDVQTGPFPPIPVLDCDRCRPQTQDLPGGRRLSFAPAHPSVSHRGRRSEAAQPAGQMPIVFRGRRTGRVIDHRHSLCQCLAHRRAAAQHQRQQAVAQLLLQHVPHIQMQRRRGVELVQQVKRLARLASRPRKPPAIARLATELISGRIGTRTVGRSISRRLATCRLAVATSTRMRFAPRPSRTSSSNNGSCSPPVPGIALRLQAQDLHRRVALPSRGTGRKRSGPLRAWIRANQNRTAAARRQPYRQAGRVPRGPRERAPAWPPGRSFPLRRQGKKRPPWVGRCPIAGGAAYRRSRRSENRVQRIPAWPVSPWAAAASPASTRGGFAAPVGTLAWLPGLPWSCDISAGCAAPPGSAGSRTNRGETAPAPPCAKQKSPSTLFPSRAGPGVERRDIRRHCALLRVKWSFCHGTPYSPNGWKACPPERATSLVCRLSTSSSWSFSSLTYPVFLLR